MFISEALIQRVSDGDLATMVELDKMGLSPAIDEDAQDFAKRLTLLNQNLSRLETELKTHPEYKIEDVTIKGSNRIPSELYTNAYAKTDSLYGFRCEWVPGFFINPSFSALFGGCAYYFFPDFYALFIIRESFRKKNRWLVYNRDELLAHELCHVARVGLFSKKYEEFFAYQTSQSAFRRLTGGIFQSQTDVFLFMGSTFLMLFIQILRTFLFPVLPFYLAWIPLLGACTYLVTALCLCIRHINSAKHNLTTYFDGDEEKARIALFHCTDNEIDTIAKCNDIHQIIGQYSADSIRWQIIVKRLMIG